MDPLKCIFFTVLFYISLTAGLKPAPSSLTQQRGSVKDEVDGLLPRNVIPIKYNIEIFPDLNYTAPPFPLTGYVEIFFTCTEVTNTIVLNYEDMTFNSISIIVDPDTPVPAPSPVYLSHTTNDDTDFLTVNVVNQLVVGAQYVIKINYEAILRDPTQRGIYYDYYTDSDGKIHYLVATQLESIFARAMYPSFDEPDLKAAFSVTIIRLPHHISLSNMNQVSSTVRPDGYVSDVYAMSPVMSTYQICVCIGEFEYVEAEWEGVTPTPIRIYSRPDMIPYLSWAAKIAPLIQVWFEQKTGITYDLPKMDHIALPSKGGAMENWGLITYSEYYLCANPDTSAVTGFITVAVVVAHELAHQWFGNLVTMEWWNDIWLNEGFATNYEYTSLESIGWSARELQQVDGSGTQQFLDTDSRNTSDPVVKPIANVWEAPSVFSGSTYPKGGAMLRQLRAILPEATLDAGITRYLNRFSYSDAVTDDLWQALTEQAEIDGVTNPDGSALSVKTVMDPWLNQMGYPVLTVTNHYDGSATVTTERFFNPLGQTADTPSAFNYEWTVPLSVATKYIADWDSVMPSHYIHIGETSGTLTGLPSDWIVVNPNQMTFMRVNYDADNRAALVNQLVTDHEVIPSQTKSQLLDDMFTFAKVGIVNETEALEFTRYLGSEMTYNPWRATLKHILYVDRITRKFLWHAQLNKYMKSIMDPVYAAVGWSYTEDESPLYQLLRRNIITTECFYGNADCYDNARADYAAYLADPYSYPVDANNLPTVLCIGVAEGTSQDWSLMLEMYQNVRDTPFREERFAYLFALSCSSNTAYLDIYLNYIVRGEKIATRDQTQALRYLVQNNVGLPLVWQYFDNSWTTVPSTISKFSVLQNIISTFYTTDDSSKFNNFVGKYPPSSDSELTQYRLMDQVILRNMDWITTNADSMSQWLVDNTPDTYDHVDTGSIMPNSPLAYWDMMPVGLDEDE
jgi:aminopeptidase N